MKQILKTPSSPHHLAVLSLSPIFLSFLPSSRSWEQGVWAVINSWHFVSATPSSGLLTPCLLPTPVWGPSHGTKSSMNFSQHVIPMETSSLQTAPMWIPSMGYSPSGTGCCNMRLQVLLAYLLQHGLFSPWVHRFWQQSATEWASQRLGASTGHLPALLWGPPWVHGRSLLPHGPPQAPGAQNVSSWSSPGAAGKSLLWYPKLILFCVSTPS